MDPRDIEARAVARYLLGVEPPEPLLARYRQAHAVLLPDPSPQDQAVLEFLRRHPWSLPFLDGATSLLAPESILRKKILLMLSILETTPAFAPIFIPPGRRLPGLLLRMAWRGIAGVAKVIAGAVLWKIWLRPAR